jgi:acyl-CoA reductase-like NAD-dependent aldehyde dehydrogenase
MSNSYPLVIDGQRVAGAQTLDVINPATGAVYATCARADAAQLEQAVQAAKRAFPGWAATPIAERRAALSKIADALEKRTDEFARIITSEQGKILSASVEEVMGACAMLRILGALEIEETIVKDDENERVIEHRTPLGVVAAITPWNVPLTLLAVKITPALLAGCTVVAKPAPTTPLSSIRFAEICLDYLPAGVFNLIVDENDLGGLLTSHPDVAKVSFTGSTATGKKVVASTANSLKRVTLELGGNDAAIILKDANPKEIAPKVFAGAMINSGQVCLAIKRAYVHETLYDEMCDELAKLADEAIFDDGMKQGSQYGPLQNKMQFEKVNALIEETRSVGTIIAGGDKHEGPGFFVRPTIVRDIPDDARLVREEQFGPVLPVLRFSDVDEVLARVNDTDYGLGGTVWAGDWEQGVEVARKVDSGLLWVNQHMSIDPTISTGGAKQSGLGRELGREGLQEFTQTKLIYVSKH